MARGRAGHRSWQGTLQRHRGPGLSGPLDRASCRNLATPTGQEEELGGGDPSFLPGLPAPPQGSNAGMACVEGRVLGSGSGWGSQDAKGRHRKGGRHVALARPPHPAGDTPTQAGLAGRGGHCGGAGDGALPATFRASSSFSPLAEGFPGGSVPAAPAAAAAVEVGLLCPSLGAR